jgi:hypothetical protein
MAVKLDKSVAYRSAFPRSLLADLVVSSDTSKNSHALLPVMRLSHRPPEHADGLPEVIARNLLSR